MNLNVGWNVANYNEQMGLKPDKLKLKLFLVIIQLKLHGKTIFKKSYSRYYIIVSSPVINFLNIYQYDSESEMNEYIISNLSNDLVYNVQVICKNKFVSGLSNEESIIHKSSSFQSVANVKLSDFEDSKENFYKNNHIKRRHKSNDI